MAFLGGSLLPARASEVDKPKRLWTWSLAALAASTAADVATSIGHQELNPVLGRSRFGGRQIGIKVGIVGGSALLQTLILKRRPHYATGLAYGNITAGALTGAVAVSNARRTGSPSLPVVNAAIPDK